MPALWLSLLALSLPPVLAQDAPVAVVPLSAIPGEPVTEPERPPVAWVVDRATLRLWPGEESRVALSVDLAAVEPTWVDLPVSGAALAVARATLDGVPVALADREDGRRWLTARLTGRHRLIVEGSVATPTASLALPLPLAARTRVELAEPGWDLTAEGGIPLLDGAVLLPGATEAALSWQTQAEPAPKPLVVAVESATAISFDESGLEGRAVLRYRVAHGSVEQVAFRLPGGCDSVEVEGPGVEGALVQGERVVVRLTRPLEGRFELQVAFRAPPPQDDRAHAAPVALPEDVHDQAGWLTLARADTAMLVPEPGPGLTPVASTALPDWAIGLAAGTPVVSYRLEGRSPRADYRLLRYEPVAAPPTVVDEARYQLATTAHGRALLKARYQVRNDRNQYLHLVPPAGFEVLGVRVAGQVRQPVADAEGGIYIPLEKSVESLQGLVSFPVDVYLLGSESAWARRGDRSLRTPAVDAPVAYARWELWLPQDVEWREVHGKPRRVEAWTSADRTLQYGRAHAAASAEEEEEIDFATTTRAARGGRFDKAKRQAPAAPPKEDEAQAEASVEVFNEAYQAYNRNDFDQAEVLLRRSLELDASNSSAQALLGNVGVLTGEAPAGGQEGKDDTQARRVRELAQARSVDDQLAQKEVLQKAEKALRAGDYEEAERELAKLEEVTRKLSRLEQSESVEQEVLLEETGKKLAEARTKAARGRASSSTGWYAEDYRQVAPSQQAAPQKPRASEEPAPQPVATQVEVVVEGAIGNEYTFDELGVEGALDLPSAAVAADRQQAAMPGLVGLRDDFDAEIDGDTRDLGGTWAAAEEPGPETVSAPEPAEPCDAGVLALIEPESEPIFGELLAGEFGLLLEGRGHGAGGLGVRGTGVGGGGVAVATGTVAAPVTAPAPRPAPRREAPAHEPRGPTALPKPSDTVTASHLVLNLPTAGERLAFEQLLVAENEPLTVDIRYRTRRRP